jgi:hypothetical protein
MMITLKQIRLLAFSFPETVEAPHFEKSSFRVKKKIFATYDGATNSTNIKLTPEDQDIFCLGDNGILAVPNKWGKQGWTTIDMNTVDEKLFEDVITTAYCTIPPKKLMEMVRRSYSTKLIPFKSVVRMSVM